MAGFRASDYDGASLIAALDAILGHDWKTYDRLSLRRNAAIEPLISILSRGEMVVVAVTNSGNNWSSATEITLPREFWQYAKFTIVREPPHIIESTKSRTIIHSNPRIVLNANRATGHGSKTATVKAWIDSHRAELEKLPNQSQRAKLIMQMIGSKEKTTKNALRDEGL